MPYSLSHFDFVLPTHLVAQEPAAPRDHARLLVYERSTQSIVDDYFYNLPKYLPAHSTLVLNNSKVEKCRLVFPGRVEVFVVETVNPTMIRALVHPGKKFRLGDTWSLEREDSPSGSRIIPKTDVIRIKTIGVDDSGVRTLQLNRPIDDAVYEQYRLTPLPPYIAQNESLSEQYQTVYADPLGSKAAPTAGLHFTSQLLERIESDHPIVRVTLHVGLGTFSPVKSENLASHKMHAEWYEMNAEAARALNAASHRTAVGTTSVRVLESAGKSRAQFTRQSGETDIFITPGYQFKATDALITNFHLPKSTLLMLVAAFVGSVDELHRIYAHAIKSQYRFYSFGDAMLIV